MSRLQKSPDENLLEYQLRLFRNKDTYDITYQEMADLINNETGQDWGESKYRKYLTPFNDGYEFAIRNNLDVTDAMKELEAKTKEFEIVKIQMQDQRREYRKYLRHEGRLDHLLQEMLDSFIDDMNERKPLEWYNKEPVKNNKQVGLLLLSDLHKEMVTDNYWNKFNEDVFHERLSQVINECIEYKDKHNIDVLHIFELGDLIEGVLHRLTRVEETETATKATQSVAESLAEMLAVLANEYSEIHWRSVRGNHDRVAARRDESVSTESFHDFVDWYLKARLKDFDNIHIIDNEIDDEIIVAEILGHTYFGVHGHLEKLGSIVSDLTLMLKIFPTAIFSGHIHHNHEKEVNGIDHVVNGGFAGTNNFAKSIRKTAKAHQKFIILDEKGRKTTEYIRF